MTDVLLATGALTILHLNVWIWRFGRQWLRDYKQRCAEAASDRISWREQLMRANEEEDL